MIFDGLKEQIDKAKRLVASWPAWKQNILAHNSRPSLSSPRPVVDNQGTGAESKYRCGACRYWVKLKSEDEYGECRALEFDERSGGLKSLERTTKPLAVVVDGSGYYAALRSRAEFGCTEWKAKENDA